MGGFNDPEIARKAGQKSKRSANKYNQDVKEMIRDLAEKIYTDVLDNLDDLETKEKAMLLPKLLEYIIAKHRSVEYSDKLDIENMSDSEVDILIDKIIQNESATT